MLFVLLTCAIECCFAAVPVQLVLLLRCCGVDGNRGRSHDSSRVQSVVVGTAVLGWFETLWARSVTTMYHIELTGCIARVMNTCTVERERKTAKALGMSAASPPSPDG